MKNVNKTETDLTRVDERLDSEQVLKVLREPMITEKESEEIEKQLDEATGSIHASLQNKDLEGEGIVIPLMSTLFLLLFIIFIVRVENIHSLNEVLNAALDKAQMGEIKDLDRIDEIIRENVIGNLFRAAETTPYNYLIGVKLTLNSAEIVKNYFGSDKVIPYIAKNFDYVDPNEQYKSEQRQGLWTYKSSNLNGKGGYAQYFINITLQESLDIWRSMKPIWLNNENFISLTIEILLQNRNLYSTLYFFKQITRMSTGRITTVDSCSGISPEMYSSINSDSVTVIGVFSSFMIVFLIQFFNFAARFKRILKLMLQQCRNPMNLYDYLEITLVILEVILIAFFIKLDLANIGKFSLPVTSKMFDDLVQYATEYKDLKRTASFVCIFSILRLVALLKIQFPSFGILFETINLLRKDLFNISFIGFILYIGFLIAGQLCYGMREENIAIITRAALGYFSTLVGKMDIVYCDDIQCKLLLFLSFSFLIIFYFILVNLLYAAIISNFSMIKKENHLLVAAKTQVLKEKTVKFLNLLLRFLDLNNKRLVSKSALKFNEIMTKGTEEDTLETPEIKEKLKDLENAIIKLNSIGHIKRLKLNMARAKNFLYKNTLETHDMYIKSIREKMRSILVSEKIDEKVNRNAEFDVEFNFMILKNFLCYFFLLIFFFVSIILFFDPKHSYELMQVNKNYLYNNVAFSEKYFNLPQIRLTEEIYPYVDQVISPLTNTTYSIHNYLYLNNTVRLTINFYSDEPNESDFSKETIAKFLSKEKNFTNFRGRNSQIYYSLRGKGDNLSYKSQGGLVFDLSDNAVVLNELFEYDKLFSFPVQSVAIEFVTSNANLNTFTYNSLFFKVGLEGLVKTTFQAIPISPEIISGQSKVIAFYALTLITSFYFIITIGIELVDIWKEKNEIRRKKLIESKVIKKVVDSIIEYDEDNQTSQTLQYILSKIKSFLNTIYSHIIQLLLVVWTYHASDNFRVLQTSSLILANYIILSMQIYSSNPFPADSVHDFSQAADYQESLKRLSAITAFILLLQIFQYFLIFPEIAKLIKSILKAKLDLIFFCLMFYTILLGYVISGHILLGHFHPDFITISDSFIYSYLIQFGQFQQEFFFEADDVIGLFFIFFYIIIIIFFLVTMFTAIITGYYEYRPTEYKLTVFEKIVKTLQCKWKGKKLIRIVEEEIDNTILDSLDRIIITAVNENQYDWRNEQELSKSFSYLRKLEKKLKINKIDFYKMCLDDNDSLKFTDIKITLNLNIEVWKSEPIDEQVKIWNTLSVNYHKVLLANNDHFVIYGIDSNQARFSNLQEKIWLSMDLEQKTSLWKGNLYEESRADIWNIEGNPSGFKELWAGFNKVQKIEYIKKFNKENGTKSIFWKLLKDSYLKLKLMINMKNLEDYEFLMYLIIDEVFESPFFSESLDEKLAQLLDDKIFKYLKGYGMYMEELVSLRKITEKVMFNKNQCECLIDYKRSLIEEIKEIKKLIRKK